MDEKRCVVLGAASLSEAALFYAGLRPNDLLLCADGGLRHALTFGLRPRALIGDGDSGGAIPPQGIESLRLPIRKDRTDTHACIDYGLAHGCRNFLLLGCAGGPRLDHFMGNLCLLEYCAEHNARARLLDGDNECLLHTGGSLSLPEAARYRYVSLFPLDAEITGVTLEGLEYPLRDATLRRDTPVAVSNQPDPKAPLVRVALTGRALIIFSERLT
ncbi:MAG: thiamine diphosphokinase [Oscillospiraceae bacterium]|jgi:thiamine pyrophosphokinase|nr:thiamine diphosphokinase [Oscillospiraceae bacterium]